MIFPNFFWPVCKCRVCFWNEDTYRADAVIPSSRLMMRMIVAVYCGLWTMWGPVYFTLPKFYLWQRWSIHSVIGNQTQYLLNYSLVLLRDYQLPPVVSGKIVPVLSAVPWRSGGKTSQFLITVLGKGKWSAFCFGHFTHGYWYPLDIV
jgi:hypothetical protein